LRAYSLAVDAPMPEDDPVTTQTFLLKMTLPQPCAAARRS